MSIYDLGKLAPALCNAKQAESYGRIAELVFKDELENEASPFAKKQSIKERIKPVTAWEPAPGMEEKKKFILDLVELAGLYHEKNFHNEAVDEEYLAELEHSVKIREIFYPDVIEIFSVKSAIAGVWA